MAGNWSLYKPYKIVLCFVSSTLGLFSQTVRAQKAPDHAEGVLIVLDRSDSMDSVLAQVKANVKELVNRIPRDEPAGLIHFSGCEDSDIVFNPKFAKNNHDKLIATVGGIEAGGATALAKALDQAYQAMVSSATCPQLIVFSDSFETCGGDPVAVARKAAQYCKEINVNFVTSSSEEKTVELYQKVLQAMRSKGKVYQVDNVTDGNKAVVEILQEGRKAQRAFSSLQQGRSQGSSPEEEVQPDGKPTEPKRRDPARSGQSQSQPQKKVGGDQ